LERVLVARDLLVALLRDHRADQHFARMQAHIALPCSSSSAAWLTSSERAHTTCETSTSDGIITSIRSRLRNDSMRLSSPSAATSSVGRSLPHCSSRAIAPLVDGAANDEASTNAMVPACTWS